MTREEHLAKQANLQALYKDNANSTKPVHWARKTHHAITRSFTTAILGVVLFGVGCERRDAKQAKINEARYEAKMAWLKKHDENGIIMLRGKHIDIDDQTQAITTIEASTDDLRLQAKQYRDENHIQARDYEEAVGNGCEWALFGSIGLWLLRKKLIGVPFDNIAYNAEKSGEYKICRYQALKPQF